MAPHSSMYFDQFGRVLACCKNFSSPLGDIRGQSIRAIWDGAAAAELRAAVDRHDYTHGCEFCGWQVQEGNDASVFARGFDGLSRGSTWPTQMEFSLTNACNLQCTMCNGDLSSAIRTHREGRAPLPAVYGDRFFDELVDFLPHLSEVKILGGEPFVGAESLRLMQMLADLDEVPRISITTNGTVCTPRIERLIARLEPNLIVSIDGATPGTYDAIRVGAHLPDVIANVDRFIALLGPSRVAITTCLMASNWHEFGATLSIAESRGLAVGVNTVVNPTRESLYRMPDLADVVASMRSSAPPLSGDRLRAWDEQIGALDRHVQLGTSAVSVPMPERWWLSFGETGPPSDHSGGIVISMQGRVGVDDDHPLFEGLDGSDASVLLDRLVEAWGPLADWESVWESDDLKRVWPTGERSTELTVAAVRDPNGALIGSRLNIVRG